MDAEKSRPVASLDRLATDWRKAISMVFPSSSGKGISHWSGQAAR
jgi:hypothetical protein